MGGRDSKATFTQAEEFAKRCRVPFLSLFLSQPPAEESPLADLRTAKDGERKKLSSNFREAINDAIVRQDWYREEFPNARPRILARQLMIDNDVAEVAAYLRTTLWINNDLLAEYSNWKDYLVPCPRG